MTRYVTWTLFLAFCAASLYGEYLLLGPYLFGATALLVAFGVNAGGNIIITGRADGTDGRPAR